MMDRVITWIALDLPKYWKTVLALIPVFVFVGEEVVEAISNEAKDGTLTQEDAFRIAVVGFTAFCVYQKRNRPMPPKPPKKKVPKKKAPHKRKRLPRIGKHRRR